MSRRQFVYLILAALVFTLIGILLGQYSTKYSLDAAGTVGGKSSTSVPGPDFAADSPLASVWHKVKVKVQPDPVNADSDPFDYAKWCSSNDRWVVEGPQPFYLKHQTLSVVRDGDPLKEANPGPMTTESYGFLPLSYGYDLIFEATFGTIPGVKDFRKAVPLDGGKIDKVKRPLDVFYRIGDTSHLSQFFAESQLTGALEKGAVTPAESITLCTRPAKGDIGGGGQ